MSVPLRLLVEAQQHVVTVELSSGDTYRGTLVRSEDNMNIQLSDVIATTRDGRVSHMDLVYVRGSHIRMFMLPDVLKYAPVFRPATVEQARSEARASKPTARKPKPRPRQ